MQAASAIGPTVAATMARPMPTTPSRAMRLSIVNQLVLLLLAAVLLAVTLLGGVVAWNLRAGFSDYLRLQDADWLARFTAEASAAVALRGMGAITGGPGTLRPLLEAVAPPEGGAPRSAAEEDAPPPRRDGQRPPDRRGPAGPPGGPPPGAQRLANRVSVVDTEGRHLSGRRLSSQDPVLERDVVVNGRMVARARLVQGVWATQDVDAAFLARQYRGIIVTAVSLMLLAVVGALWVGRRWVRPVQAAQQAARRIAQGALDVRVQLHGNDELTDLAHDINAMADALQQLESSRRRWIAELSHEMRTPLAVLQGEVEALIDGVRPTNGAALHSLHEEVARVSRLVEDFHQLALSDLRALPCHFAPVQPQRVLHDAATRVAARMQAAGLVLVLDGAAEGAVPSVPLVPSAPSVFGAKDDASTAAAAGSAARALAPSAGRSAARPVTGGPAVASWDSQRIGQLLSNLLENSLRYTDAPGHVHLSLAPVGRTGGAVAGAPVLTITVQDSSPCVPDAELTRLFEPLYRADASRSRRSGGSGLGLAICRAIAHSHGGRIEARRSTLGGLCVVVTLPLHPLAAG